MSFLPVLGLRIVILLSLNQNIMANFYPTILTNKPLKDGRFKVRIAVSHNGTTRYIPTDVVVENERQWRNGQVVKHPDASYLNTKLRAKVTQVSTAFDTILYPEGLSCAELVTCITGNREKRLTLAEAFEELMSVSTAKPSTIAQNRHRFNSITTIIPGSTPMTMLTPLMIQRYIKRRSGELTDVTIHDHLTLIAHIINYCQRNGYTEFTRSPVEGLRPSGYAVRRNWLTPDQVRMIRDLNLSFKGEIKFRDMFMLSYYLGGINLIDIEAIDWRTCRRTLRYRRTKTERSNKVNGFVEFEIPDEAKPIIKRYMGKDGHIHVTKLRSSMVRNGTNMRNRHPGLEGMTFYSARKSFAQHAFQLGISESVIDFILGHSLSSGKKSTIYSYIKVTPAMATEAIRKVLDFIGTNNNFD